MTQRSRIRMAACLAPVLLLTLAAPSAGVSQSAETGERLFVVYEKGIPRAEWSVADQTQQLRRRDPATTRWSDWISAPSASVADDDRFALWGAIGGLPGQLESLESLDWTRGEAHGWPDASSLYVRHQERHARTSEGVVRGVHWALADATAPMDLIFGDDGRLVAAFDVRSDLVAVRSGSEGLTTVGQWLDEGISQPLHGYRELPMTMIRGEDGVGLATRVYLPTGSDGPFPTVLVRTPYGITDLMDAYWHYAARGYAVVLQAARGTAYWDPPSLSEGSWDPMINEPRDGARALEWIVDQPWSDGQICMQGGSYVGYTQWAASMSGNPALKCLVPESSMGTAFSDQPYMGGGFVEGLAYYMIWMLNRHGSIERSWTEILHHRPLVDIDRFATGEDIPQWNDMLENWRNAEFWKPQDWYADPGPRHFGALQISGWFDDDFPGTRANWELMQQRGVGPQKLIVGPWRHGYNSDRALNGFSYGSDALRDDIWLVKQRWYDHHLKGMDAGVGGNTVDYFVLGENRWRTAASWPPEDAREQAFYFHSTGQANRFFTDGKLSTDPPQTDQPPDRYTYDPAYPPENWYSFDLMESWADVQSFPYDFKDVEGRPDVVAFTSDVLDEDITIAGDVRVVLYASTDVLDTDWWVHLSDVHPDNSSIRLTVGMLRARFRGLDDPAHQISGSNFAEEELLSGDPADVVRYEIAIPSVANTFKAGHRIRIAVMNALDNYGFPNSNTGGDEATVTHTVPGNMVIHHSPGRASHVVLNVLPAGRP